ncbi:NAD(P)H-dependent glycerol-3-phosphate dehydrogenase [Camelimonas abortus]|uniref:Glycerol-3-phosphate dehydrogenase [NAD(P)+] n=1 Tax=Camelimonas abortus TaxID=1017184 RepID=A0ABV7LCC9_9HYPH
MTVDAGGGVIAVIGAGAWGVALANAAARAGGAPVPLWGRDGAAVAAMAATREAGSRLPGVRLEDGVAPAADPAPLANADAVLLVIPAQQIRDALARLRPWLGRKGLPVVICAKGIERASGLFMSDVVREMLPEAAPAVLSGPSFAADVARGLPTAVSLAADDEALAARLARRLSGPALRIYHTTDMRGVEIGGAAKNVLAIACGIVMGRGLGESARAALVARGFAEITRFAEAYGARRDTLMGLSGLGDIVLTCGSRQSRNFAFGEALGRGAPVAEASGGKLTEGAATAAVMLRRAADAGVDMPVSAAVAAILDGRMGIDDAIGELMMRPLRREG